MVLVGPFIIIFSLLSLRLFFMQVRTYTHSRGRKRKSAAEQEKIEPLITRHRNKKKCAHEIKEAEEEGEIELCVEIWHEMAWESSLLFREFPGCRCVEIHSCVEEDGPVRAMCVCDIGSTPFPPPMHVYLSTCVWRRRERKINLSLGGGGGGGGGGGRDGCPAEGRGGRRRGKEK